MVTKEDVKTKDYFDVTDFKKWSEKKVLDIYGAEL